KHSPDVVIGHDGLLDCIQKLGIRIPADLAFAHTSLPSELSRLNLSGLNQNWKIVGEAAVDNVVAQIHRNERGIPSHPKTVMMEGSWVEGETTPNVNKVYD